MLFLILAAADPGAIDLVCRGGGNRRNHFSGEQYSETIRVEIVGDGGRIQLPPSMLPPELSGGDGGWYKFRSFRKTESEYRATVKVNFINFPSILIDRVVGTIRIDGGQSGFSGQCETVDTTAAPKF